MVNKMPIILQGRVF